MNIKWSALFLSSSLALSFVITTPAMADESNKRIEFEFSAPVQIPGHVLTAGKYVFQLLDSPSDRNIVQIFSEDTNGNETLIDTIAAVPDYVNDTPDKPLVHFEERRAGAPEAIHSWFYPGDNTGWEFVYPKGQTLEADATTPPDSTPAAAAAAPSIAPAPLAQQVAQKESAPEVASIEEGILFVQNETPVQPPVQGTEIQTGTTTQVLPQTAGNSGLALLLGVAMLGSGVATLFGSRRWSAGLN